jgi:uncharacterized protein (DUF433 family)
VRHVRRRYLVSIAEEDALIQEYIEPHPSRPGPADVRLRRDAVPVWALVNYWRAAEGDAQRVADDYGLTLEAVQAALAYYRRHPEVIDGRIAANALP